MIDLKYLERLADEATLDYLAKLNNLRLAKTALRLCEREAEEAYNLLAPIVAKYLKAKLSVEDAPADKGEQG